MYKAIVENLSTLANLVWSYGSTLIITGGFNILSMATVTLILVLFTATIARKKFGGFVKPYRGRNKRGSRRLFESQRGPVLKPCPNCAEQLPVTAIICGICDYNFLAERPGRGQRLLPQPSTQEVAEQNIASAEL
jgi:hypothetical protein